MPNDNHQHIPSDLKQVGLVMRYDIYKHLRSKRLLSIIVIEIVVLALILMLPPLLGHAYPKDAAAFVGNFASFVNILVIIGATLFAGDAIVSEYQNRTGYLLFPNPVKRWTLFTGKLFASIIVMTLVMGVYYAVAITAGIGATGSISVLAFYSFLLALLYSLACVGIGFLLSSVFKGATGALVFTFALLFMLLPIVDGVTAVAGVKVEASLTFAGGTINYILTDPYPHDFPQTFPIAAGQNLTVWNYFPNVGIAIVVMLVYAGISLAIAMVAFQRREMLG